MANTQQKENDKANVIGPAIAGAAFGAAVGASAVMLSDKKKRKQIINTVHTMKDKANDILQQAKTKISDLQSSTQDTLDDLSDTVSTGTQMHKNNNKTL